MLAATSSRDNWERLVAAVLKKDQIWRLCHQDSITTISSSDFSQRLLSFSSISPRHVSSSPSPDQLPLTKVEDRNNPSSKTITQKLISALLWRRKPSKVPGEGLVGIPEDHFGVESFSLCELLVATDKFSNKNILGYGGHSTVYKGRLADGSLVAVKRYRAETDQVMINNELEISSSLVAHRNVLHLRGLCFTQKEQLLVYPYMANGSVASCLRERSESQAPLHWGIRLQIALGAAKGLAYMHHECVRGIIHRDFKAANILLDDGFEAVVADFSLAKFDDGYNTRVYGTAGHIAPEYLATGHCSEKTDVYGYGIFLLELLTGQRAFDSGRIANYEDPMILDWVRKLFNRKSLEVMVDQDLEGNFVEEDTEKLFQIALICTRSDPEGRPTMPEVVRMLEDGDGLAERWQDSFSQINVCESIAEIVRWHVLSQNVTENDPNHYPKWSIDEYYTSSSASEDELSGPR